MRVVRLAARLTKPHRSHSQWRRSIRREAADRRSSSGSSRSHTASRSSALSSQTRTIVSAKQRINAGAQPDRDEVTELDVGDKDTEHKDIDHRPRAATSRPTRRRGAGGAAAAVHAHESGRRAVAASRASGATTVTNRTTTASGAMFCRTNSCGPENRFATRRMPAVSTLISGNAHMTRSNTSAASVSAITC